MRALLLGLLCFSAMAAKPCAERMDGQPTFTERVTKLAPLFYRIESNTMFEFAMANLRVNVLPALDTHARKEADLRDYVEKFVKKLEEKAFLTYDEQWIAIHVLDMLSMVPLEQFSERLRQDFLEAFTRPPLEQRYLAYTLAEAMNSVSDEGNPLQIFERRRQINNN